MRSVSLRCRVGPIGAPAEIGPQRDIEVHAALHLALDEIGRLLPGYRADIIAVDGNPASDIGALKTVGFVMAGGRIVKND